MKKFFVLMIGVVLVLGFSGVASSVEVNDAGDSPIGPIDLLTADAEIYDRGDVDLLKISISATPNLPGAITFEVDVDNSTGTGGALSQIGTPVPPCPCKVEPGFDIVAAIYTRTQGDSSGSAIGAFCQIGPELPNLEGTQLHPQAVSQSLLLASFGVYLIRYPFRLHPPRRRMLTYCPGVISLPMQISSKLKIHREIP